MFLEMNTSYRPDQYQQNRPQQQGGLGGLFNNANNKPYVTKQSVMTGLTGAAVGFMVGGPMGAINWWCYWFITKCNNEYC
jgi:hypothetical protein